MPQVNTNLTEEDIQKLEALMREAGYLNRSAFVRWLIRQEWKRRQRLADVLSDEKANVPLE